MSLRFDIGILNLGKYGCVTMRQHVAYIFDISMTLTFDLYVGGGGILSEFYSPFLFCYL